MNIEGISQNNVEFLAMLEDFNLPLPTSISIYQKSIRWEYYVDDGFRCYVFFKDWMAQVRFIYMKGNYDYVEYNYDVNLQEIYG